MQNLQIRQAIQQTTEKHKMLSPGDHILAAVSGGADSLCLLYILLHLQKTLSHTLPFTISICHINHNLRGKDSDADAEFVKKLAHDLNLPFHHHSIKINASQTSLEEAARQARYSCLIKSATESGANKIATGHNQNDNAETLIMRLCRGTGLSGLGGIPPVRILSNPTNQTITFIRPLIETNRTEIEAFLSTRNIKYRTDKTNFDKTFFRNRIRHDIIPSLCEINPQIVSSLTKSAELLREDENLLEELTSTAAHDCLTEKGIFIPNLQKHHPALQKRIIRAALKQADEKATLRDISSLHIAQIEALVKKTQSGKEVHLPKNLRARREYDHLLIFNIKDKISDHFCYDIPLNSPIFIPDIGHYVQASVISGEAYRDFVHINERLSADRNSHEICTKYFNYDKINESLIKGLQIRTRRPGDRIAIEGGTKKLKNEFSDRKIPQDNRDKIPLLALEGDILWIMGGRTSVTYTPKPGCKLLRVEVFDKWNPT